MDARTTPQQLLYGFLPRKETTEGTSLKSGVEGRQIAAKTDKNGQGKVNTETVNTEQVQLTAKNRSQKTSKKTDKTYQEIPEFTETGEILFFKCKKLQGIRLHQNSFVSYAPNPSCL